MKTYDFESADKRFIPVDHSSTFNKILDTLGLRSKKVLDLGCGYGEYLVKFGADSLGVTSTTEEVEYGKSRNIRIMKGNVELIENLNLNEKFEAIWANNLFEHLLSPHSFLMTLKTVSKDKTLLILGVPVIPRIASMLKLKKFRGALALAHINFFTRESLRLTVEKAGWKVGDIRPFVFSMSFLDRLFSFFAPHLYIVAYNDAAFTYPDKKMKEWQDEPHYDRMLKIGRK